MHLTKTEQKQAQKQEDKQLLKKEYSTLSESKKEKWVELQKQQTVP